MCVAHWRFARRIAAAVSGACCGLAGSAAHLRIDRSTRAPAPAGVSPSAPLRVLLGRVMARAADPRGATRPVCSWRPPPEVGLAFLRAALAGSIARESPRAADRVRGRGPRAAMHRAARLLGGYAPMRRTALKHAARVCRGSVARATPPQSHAATARRDSARRRRRCGRLEEQHH